MKRFQFTLLLVILVFTLGACKDTEPSQTLTDPPVRLATSETTDDRFNVSLDVSEQPLLDTITDLSSGLENLVKTEKIVGGEVLLIENGVIKLHQANGWNDKDNNIALELGQIVKIHELTTLFIRIAVLMLQEQNKLNICEPVSKYLPSYDNPFSNRVLIHNLMQHNSGITSEYSKTASDYENLEEAIIEIGENGKLKVPENKRYRNNINTDILAFLINKVSGLDYQDYIEDNIFIPLGLKHSFFRIEEHPELLSLISARYDKESNGNLIKTWDNSMSEAMGVQWPSTSAYSTINDFAVFISAWLNNGEINGVRILSEDLSRTWKILSHTQLYLESDSECVVNDIPSLRDDYDPVDSFGYWPDAGSTFVVLPKNNIVTLYFNQSLWGEQNRYLWMKLGNLHDLLNWK